MPNDGSGKYWDETHPSPSDLLALGERDIRDLRKGVRLRVCKEHTAFEEGSISDSRLLGGGGEHLPGSARGYVVAGLANLPALRPDGVTPLNDQDYGRMAIDRATMLLWVWDDGVWKPVKSATGLVKVTWDTIDEDPSPFTVGMVCTQAVSNAVGIYMGRDDIYAYFQRVSGQFDDSHDITGTGEYPPVMTVKGIEQSDISQVPEGYVLLHERESGTFESGSWRRRRLTVEVADTRNVCSVTSDAIITLSAGVYRYRIRCPAFSVNKHQTRLVLDVAGSPAYVYGTSEWAGDGQQTASELCGRIRLPTPQQLEIQHYCTATRTGNGFGVASTPQIPSGVNVYSTAEFWKEV